MQYHAAMLLRSGADVHVIAFAGREPVAELAASRLTLLPSLDRWVTSRSRSVALAGAAARAVVHFILALRALRGVDLDVLIVQTPPAFPTLPLLLLIRSRTRVIIDWHNVTADVAAARVGLRGRAMLLRLERWLAGRFTRHLTVSRALTARLREWKIEASTFHDAPWAEDEPDRERGRRLLARAGATAQRVAVTSTSWSRDEDFDLLLGALAVADRRLGSGETLDVVITGDGPRKAAFLAAFEVAALERVRVITAWFEHADFIHALSGADLAFSLHRSVSGLDLPMKLFDFAAAGRPIAVLDYGAVLREIDDTSWLMFKDQDSLASLFLALVRDELPPRAFMPRGESWSSAWTRIVRPLVDEGRRT